VARLVRDGVALGYEEAGHGDPALIFVHGVACHRGFWQPQLDRFARDHRVIAIDLRGHGESDAPRQPYTMRAFADDVAWMSRELKLRRPVIVGHSLGGLVALELAAAYPDRPRAVALIDSVLLASGHRPEVVHDLVDRLHGADAVGALRGYFELFFSPYDDPGRKGWILDTVARTPPHVSSSVWEESTGWDAAAALRSCTVPLLYLDAGTPNADLVLASALLPTIMVGRTVGSGHFSQLEVPDQVNAMLARFIGIRVPED
jgi:pimeloyl-ACP methyl ester carboxylesterase